jgi:hypothetical protein
MAADRSRYSTCRSNRRRAWWFEKREAILR